MPNDSTEKNPFLGKGVNPFFLEDPGKDRDLLQVSWPRFPYTCGFGSALVSESQLYQKNSWEIYWLERGREVGACDKPERKSTVQTLSTKS